MSGGENTPAFDPAKDPDRTDEPYDIRTSFVAAHEMYTSARAAGFAHSDAMYLIACALSGGPRAPADGEPA